MTDLNDAAERGYIAKAPHYNSVFNVFDAETTAAILETLIVQTSLPLKALEQSFACDSTGFSACRFDRWYDHKHGTGKDTSIMVKLHAMTGISTNVVTAVEIHDKNAGDATKFSSTPE